jgi:hypothetical protein
MATQVQFRGGTTSEHSSFTGVSREITIDTDKDTIVVHDGSTVGGFPLVSERGGAFSGDVTFGDSNKMIMGAGSDLQIYHDGSNSYISDQGTGQLVLLSNSFKVSNASNSESIITAEENGAVSLFFNDSSKLATTATGVDVTGTLAPDAITSAGQISVVGSSASTVAFSVGDTGTGLYNTGSNSLGISTAGTFRMLVDNSGRVGVGTNSPDAPLHVEGANGTQLVVEATSGDFAQMDFKIGGTQKGAIWTHEATDLMGFFAPSGWGQNFYTNGTETMRLTSAGNLGIGSTSVPMKLTVRNGSANSDIAKFTGDGTGGGLTISTASTTRSDDTVIFKASDAFGEIAFKSDNTEVLRITKDNNVGIGTSSPDTLLQLQQTTSGAISAGGARQGSVIKLHHEAQWEAGYNSTPTDFLGAVEFSSGDTSGSGLAGEGVRAAIRAPVDDAYNNVGLSFETGGTRAENMRLTYAGDLGLGSTSPHSTAWGANGNGTQMEISGGTGTSGYGVLHLSGSGDTSTIKTYTQAVGDGNFYMAYDVDTNSHRMIMNASGDVFIGKTSFNNDVGCAFSQSGVGYFVASGSVPLLVNRLGVDGVIVQFYNDSNGVGSISVSGSTTSYATSSDYRLKTDVQPMTGASARVQALNPVNFEWISNGTRVDGFLAHEAATVVPEAITGTKDAMKEEEYEVTPAVEATRDEEGNILTEAVDAVMGTRSVIDPQGIDQSKLVPLLTAALQEALTKIDSLETRITALEGA